jgi:hypothetical protein
VQVISGTQAGPYISTTTTPVAMQFGSASGGALTSPAQFVNPMTTAGDLIQGGTGGTPTRVAAGGTISQNTTGSSGSAAQMQSTGWWLFENSGSLYLRDTVHGTYAFSCLPGSPPSCYFDGPAGSSSTWQFGGHAIQDATGKLGGTCAMASSTSCTWSLVSAFALTPICVATPQGTTAIAGACSVSGTTVTITAASSNSLTWGAVVIGNTY